MNNYHSRNCTRILALNANVEVERAKDAVPEASQSAQRSDPLCFVTFQFTVLAEIKGSFGAMLLVSG